jgi:hypothetical protein
MTPIPCRFCGAAPSVTSIFVHYDSAWHVGPREMVRIACSCGAIGKCRTDEAAAVASWNEPWQALVYDAADEITTLAEKCDDRVVGHTAKAFAPTCSSNLGQLDDIRAAADYATVAAGLRAMVGRVGR